MTKAGLLRTPLSIVAVALAVEAYAGVTGSTFIASVGTATTAAADPTLPGQFLIAGRSGTISRLDATTGQVDPTPYLTIPGVDTRSEGGLLGLALDPNYESNGYGYAYYTVTRGTSGLTSRIARFQRDPADPTRALADSITPLLSFDQPQNNHNAGWIGFSPNDGYLYIASGDGGGSNDNGTGHTPGIGNSQDITNNLLGKMLRIDVSGDDFPADAGRNYAIPADNPFVGVTGDDEIWSYGLRNPFRNSFDRQTGDLWIADVGQSFLEEVNFQPGDSPGGENYGWRLREGSVATPTGGVGGPKPPGAVDPVYEYFHTNNASADPLFTGNSITGGVAYRGYDPSLQGHYFFADAVASRYWKFDPADPFDTVENITGQLFGRNVPTSPVAFVEDLTGEIYVLSLGGGFYRMDMALPGDYDGDSDFDTDDYAVWSSLYGGSDDLAADGNRDGVVDAADYTVWRDALAAAGGGVPEPSSATALALAWLIAASASRRGAA
ncbi:PQQ-dependent sugar dehydrogenase [Botrimarina sp.]|uniref:PQQ-dependent sugar dehydrogenase n=1 Tax=Botrimarina sp. TaxID=2795802 RepID=UPI0032EC6C77